MKSKLLSIVLLTTLVFNVDAQSPVCFTTPDGTDASGWSYKDYIIPAGYRIDSVYMDATRPGYVTSDFDFVFQSCQGATTYNAGIVTYPFDYSADNNPEYNTWIDLTAFNYAAVGMVRVCLPTNAGAVWNQVCFAISVVADSSICFSTADGTDASGWSYKDFVIPTGYKVDSVFMDASRAGYTSNDFDFVFQSCAGTTSYSAGTVTYPFDYSTDPNSEYNIWIDLTPFNYSSVGMVRACLPTNASAIWNQVCFAISPSTTTNVNQNLENNSICISPNPATEFISVKNAKANAQAEILNMLGQRVKAIQNISHSIDISDLPKGFYCLKITEQNICSVKTATFIKK